MIKLVNVCKSYKDNVVLKDFNYCFDNKGLYLIVGKSGVGKTTLLNIISGYDNLHDGDVYKENDTFYLRIDDLIGSFTVRENIELIKDLNECYKLDKEMYGLDNVLDKNVDTLSIGEKQRLVFYLSIISNKKIVLLDEPLSNLDYLNKERLVKKIIKESKKRLFIVVTHEISEFKDYVLIDLENKQDNYVDSILLSDYKKNKIKIDLKKWGNILFKKSFISLLFFVISVSGLSFSFKDFKNELLDFKQSFLNSYTEGTLLYKPNDLNLDYQSFYNGVVVNLANEIEYYGSSIYSYEMYEDEVYLDNYYFDNGFIFSNVYMGNGIKEDEVVVSMNFYNFCNKNNIDGCNKEAIKENLIGKKLKFVSDKSYEYVIKEIVEGDNLIYVNDINAIKNILLNEYRDYAENYYIAINNSKLDLFYKKINLISELLKYDFYEYFNEGEIHYFLIKKAEHEYFSYDEIEKNKLISCSSIISCTAFDYLNLKGLHYIDNIDVNDLMHFEINELGLSDDEIVISSGLSDYLKKKKNDVITLKYYLYDSFYSKSYKVKEIINNEEFVIYNNHMYLYSLVGELTGKSDRIEYAIGDRELYQRSELLYSDIIKETRSLVFKFLTIVNCAIHIIYFVIIALMFMIEIKRNKNFYSFYRILKAYEVINKNKVNYLSYVIYFMIFLTILFLDVYFSLIYLIVLLIFIHINKIKIQVSLD